MPTLEILRDFGVTAIAAFAGAWAVLLLEERREQKREESRNYLAMRFAHFATLAQFSELISLRDNEFAPFQGKDDAWRMMHPLLARFSTPKFAPETLVPMLASDDPDLLNRLTVGQQKFEAFRGNLELRNTYHQELQARMSALIAQGAVLAPSEEDLHRLVGRDVVGGLKGTTAALFASVGETAKFLEKNLADLKSYSERNFPKRRPPSYAIPEKHKHA